MILLPRQEPREKSYTVVNYIIKDLLLEMARHAAYNSTWRYATGRMDFGGSTSSLAQCVPDMAPGDCWECLRSISEWARSYLQGDHAWKPSHCALQFEVQHGAVL